MQRRQFLQTTALSFATVTFSHVFTQTAHSQVFTKHQSYAPEILISFLREQIPILIKQHKIPGVAIALIEEGNLLWSQGFGIQSEKTHIPVTDETIFPAASLGKPLFAYMALKLYERGLLDLDRPLTDYTAQPYIKDPRLETITPRIVLNHTTGFPNWSGDLPVWIEAEPGSRFGYSGEGYLYLQKVIEEITGEPFRDYSRREFFLPLNMPSSSYTWEPEYENRAVDGHDRDLRSYPMRRPKTALAAGSLRTTATDYAQFLQIMMQEGDKDSLFMQPDTLETMLTPQVSLTSNLDWGLGWALETTNHGSYFWHWGDGGIFKSFTLASREHQNGIVILTNSQNGLKICEQILQWTMVGGHPAFGLEMINY